ncbi:hypothetical protein [Neochlamydia sp. AcF84]|nr:hypothetical protein [Neochlamydia sp. AcF84]
MKKNPSLSINHTLPFSSKNSPVNSISFPTLSLGLPSLHPLSEQLVPPFNTDSLHLNCTGMGIIGEVNELATSVIGGHSQLLSLQQVAVESLERNIHLSQHIGDRHYETGFARRAHWFTA